MRMVSFEWLGWQEAAHFVASNLAPDQSSRAKRREDLGNISEWKMPELDYLALELGSWEPIIDAKTRLIGGAASGSIRTCDTNGVPIHSAKWRSHKLVEPHGDLRLLRDPKSAWSEGLVALFNREDVDALIHGGDHAVPAPDQQGQFDGELRRRSKDKKHRRNGYRDEMIQWAKTELGLSPDAAAALWDNRSKDFPRVGRHKKAA
jgi:hypothetical protein